MEMAALKVLRFYLGITRTERGTSTSEGEDRLDVLDNVREARFGHVQRRDSDYIGRRMLNLEL